MKLIFWWHHLKKIRLVDTNKSYFFSYQTHPHTTSYYIIMRILQVPIANHKHS